MVLSLQAPTVPIIQGVVEAKVRNKLSVMTVFLTAEQRICRLCPDLPVFATKTARKKVM